MGWLTTVRADGMPQSSPVWFVIHDGAIFVRSRPGAGKLRNIAANPRVGFHLDGDGQGGDIVTIEGVATVTKTMPEGLLSSYLAKYETLMVERLQTTADALAEQFSETIQITPQGTRAW